MQPQTSFTYKLTAPQQDALERILRNGSFRLREVPYTRVAVEAADFNVSLYTSGSCVIQGKGARDWITFTLEPEVLLEARLGYEDVIDPTQFTPHMGVDESGKGDFFGPLVIAAAYVDEQLAHQLRALRVRDSKRITSDRVAEQMAGDIAKILGHRFAVVSVGPRAYNRLYAKMRNVNRMLAWGHARAIEDLLERVPDCPRALSDQFGPTQQIERALMAKGRNIKLEQRPKAESDVAVAAASILARAGFIRALRDLGTKLGTPAPKGASPQVQEAARKAIQQHGPGILLDTAKCHFKTADEVLAATGHHRSELGPEGQAQSRTLPARKSETEET
jgi:ribonuclease HIII